MPVDVLAQTVLDSFQPVSGASGGRLLGSISDIVNNRAKWRSWVSAHVYKGLTPRTGGGFFATGAAGAVAAGGLPIAWAVYSWVALGLPLYEARKIVENENTQSGFSQGWVTGLLGWEWRHVADADRFGRRNLIRIDVFDPQMNVIRVEAYNKGLVAGFLAGRATPDDLKKEYLRKLRLLAGGVRAGSWSRNEQISYVIALAGAARGYGIIKFTG